MVSVRPCVQDKSEESRQKHANVEDSDVKDSVREMGCGKGSESDAARARDKARGAIFNCSVCIGAGCWRAIARGRGIGQAISQGG